MTGKTIEIEDLNKELGNAGFDRVQDLAVNYLQEEERELMVESAKRLIEKQKAKIPEDEAVQELREKYDRGIRILERYSSKKPK